MYCSENSGSPVTRKSTVAHVERPAGGERGEDEALPPGRLPGHPDQYIAARNHASGRSMPGEREQDQHRHAAPRARGLERRRPHHERHVRDVDVAARGQERVVEARQQQRGGDRADQRRGGDPAEPVDAGDQHQERAEDHRHPQPVGPRRRTAAAPPRRRSRADARSGSGSRRRPAGRRAAGRAPTAASSRSRRPGTSGRRRSRSRSPRRAARTTTLASAVAALAQAGLRARGIGARVGRVSVEPSMRAMKSDARGTVFRRPR